MTNAKEKRARGLELQMKLNRMTLTELQALADLMRKYSLVVK